MSPIPIAIRTRNRPAYLDVTLKSLMASALPPGTRPVILDDCSDDPAAARYLTTDDAVELPRPVIWPASPLWLQRVGKIADIRRVKGIKSKFEVWRPPSMLGDRGGAFWAVRFVFELFPDADLAILLEDDIVLHKDWFAALLAAHEQAKDRRGPNGNRLGMLTAYDRRGGFRARTGFKTWGFRSLAPYGNGRWGCGDAIGGVMYLMPRGLYEENKDRLSQSFPPSAKGGDTWLLGMCGDGKWNIACTVPSFCQHIGVESLSWPAKGWRNTPNFQRPFAFEKFDGHGVACSDEWR